MIPQLNHTEDTVIVSIALVMAAWLVSRQLKAIVIELIGCRSELSFIQDRIWKGLVYPPFVEKEMRKLQERMLRFHKRKKTDARKIHRGK